jgi:hypothetical protein
MTATTDSHTYAELDEPDTNNATFIVWWQFPQSDFWEADFLYSRKQRYFEHLDRYNSGFKNGKWGHDEYHTFLANDDLVDSLSDSLELSQEERSKAKSLIHRMDLQREGIKVERMAFAACAFAVHSSTVDERKCHPQSDLSKEFQQVKEKLAISDNEFASDYGKVQDRDQRLKHHTSEYDKFGTDRSLERRWISGKEMPEPE